MVTDIRRSRRESSQLEDLRELLRHQGHARQIEAHLTGRGRDRPLSVLPCYVLLVYSNATVKNRAHCHIVCGKALNFHDQKKREDVGQYEDVHREIATLLSVVRSGVRWPSGICFQRDGISRSAKGQSVSSRKIKRSCPRRQELTALIHGVLKEAVDDAG